MRVAPAAVELAEAAGETMLFNAAVRQVSAAIVEP
jgi:hypothetical protein